MNAHITRRAIRSLCDLNGVAVAFEGTGSGHQRAIIEHCGIKRCIVFASSASDWRAIKNDMARVRRSIREIRELDAHRRDYVATVLAQGPTKEAARAGR